MINEFYNNIKFFIQRVFYNKIKIQKKNKLVVSRMFNEKNNIQIFGSNNDLKINADELKTYI